VTLLHLCLLVTSVVVSFVSTWLIRNVAVTHGWLTWPASKRDVHVRAVPRLGGIAIVVTFLFSVAIASILSPSVRSAFIEQRAIYLLLPALLVFFLGLYDDIHRLTPAPKFAVQALAGGLLYLSGFRVTQIPILFGSHGLGSLLGLAATIFWVLWITNAFNLLDGLDGLAAGSALFSTAVLFVLALLKQNFLLSVLTIALSGAILGFLRFNFNPATIFLGDCGSLFIGFLLSALALSGMQKAPTLVAVAIPVVSFGLPVLDTLISVLRRFLSGRPLFMADREHIHHKLLQRGLNQRQVVVILYAVTAIFGLLSLFFMYPIGPPVALVLVLMGTGIWIGVQHLNYPEVLELKRIAHRTFDQKAIIINNLAIRQATDKLRSCTTLISLREILEEVFAKTGFDSFELALAWDQINRPPDSSFSRRNSDEFSYVWKKSDDYNLNADLGALELRLELLNDFDGRLVRLVLKRQCTKDPLLLDVNLLTLDFHNVLNEATARATLALAVEDIRDGDVQPASLAS